MKRVNDARVCDVCFLKLKNISGEKRKKKVIQINLKLSFYKLLKITLKQFLRMLFKVKKKSNS